MPIKLLNGGREGLEFDLLDAIVNHNGDRKRIDELKGRLGRRENRLHAVNTATGNNATSVSANPSDDDGKSTR